MDIAEKWERLADQLLSVLTSIQGCLDLNKIHFEQIKKSQSSNFKAIQDSLELIKGLEAKAEYVQEMKRSGHESKTSRS